MCYNGRKGVNMANKTEARKTKTNNTQAIVIAVLTTVIVCVVIVFAVLMAMGVIKFGGGDSGSGATPVESGGTGSSNSGNSTDNDSGRKLVENTYPFVSVDDSIAAIVGDLTFYLPDEFDVGGKNADGAFTYNLTDDDGWAQVVVYAEKSDLTPQEFLLKIGPTLDITDMNYQMNGTTWVQGENANSLAYATRLDDKIYAVYYSVKLDSDATAEAMQMIPKTLYMGRIYEQ